MCIKTLLIDSLDVVSYLCLFCGFLLTVEKYKNFSTFQKTNNTFEYK